MGNIIVYIHNKKKKGKIEIQYCLLEWKNKRL